MKEKKAEGFSPVDLVAATTATVLGLNFTAFLILSLPAIGASFDPVLAIVTAAFVIIGLIIRLILRRFGASKFWRRILLATVICNFCIVIVFCFMFAAMFISFLSA